MPAPTFELCLVCADVRPSPGGELAYANYGTVLVPECPATFERFLVFRLVGQDNAVHEFSYEIERPDGSVTEFVQAPPSTFPDWLKAQFPSLPPGATAPPPEQEETRVGAKKATARYFQLTAFSPGEHRVHILVDGQREHHAVFRVEESAD